MIVRVVITSKSHGHYRNLDTRTQGVLQRLHEAGKRKYLDC